VPVAVVTAGAAVGAAAAALAGSPSVGTASVAVVLAPVLTLSAAMSARRGGRVPQSVLVTAMAADPTGGASTFIGWFTWWPSVAIALSAVPLLLAEAGMVALALAWVAIATYALGGMVHRDPAES
jgi:hypothetical protein